MKVLITGGAGFIGSHVARAYIGAGHDVVIVDNLITGSRENVPPGARFYEADVTEPALDELFAQEQPDVVSHHAAQMNVRRSVADPLHDTRTNVLGGVRVFENCVRHGVRKLIFASSGGTVYGEAASLPIAESAPLRPLTPYGASKVACETFLYGYHVRTGLKCTVLRYANVYGPGQNPHGEAGIVAIYLDRMQRRQPFAIFGDGSQVRDYIFIDDVVQCNLQALGEELPGYAVYNVGTGVGTSVGEIVQLLAELAPAPVTVVHQPANVGELQANVLATAHAQTSLGWKPKVDLPTGLKRTVERCSLVRNQRSE